MTAEAVPYITEQEYLEGEQRSPVKHEYYDGQVYAMAGATDEHELVSGNMMVLLANHVRGTGCRVYKSDMKVRLQFRGKSLFYYPDVMISCDPSESHPLYRERPKLIVEVLSKKRKKDTIEKAAAYSRIPTLEEYVLLDPRPHAPEVQISRRADGWEPLEVVAGMGAEFTLRSVGITLKVADLFQV